MSKMIVMYNKDTGEKHCVSDGYNFKFNSKTGEFARWGKTFSDDPKWGMLEIFDLEISEVCHGIPKPGTDTPVVCGFCYKTNSPVGTNMSFETFKDIFNKLPRTLTQIAFGIGDIWSNPDLVKIMDYCRDNDHNPGVVPNLTTNGYGLTDEWVKTLAERCGGVAVSRYENYDVCYDAVKKLTDSGIEQVTIHQLLSVETYDQCIKAIDDCANDPRLTKLKAILFLTLKPKGKRNKQNILKDVSKYRKLVEYAMEKQVNIGFDSCSAPIFLMAMKDHPNFKNFSMMSESCESNRFSGYANAKGEYWHCSFTEEQPGWSGIDLTKIEDFQKDVWMAPEVIRFRNKLICQNNEHIDKECYLCPVFDLYNSEIGNASDTVYRPTISIYAEQKVVNKDS